MALEEDVEICAEADDAEQAILEAARTQPEVCVVGWETRPDALTTVRGILDVAPNAAVIVLAGSSSVDDLLAAVHAGAIGYVPGDIKPPQLRRVVRAVVAHEAAVPRSMVRELLVGLRAATARRAVGITGREAEVLDMLRHGDSTTEIARRLEISPVTVRRHISDLMHKLGAEDRAALVRIGEEISGGEARSRPDDRRYA
jgi:DNA-binding NarL/FixJ family response regulator